MSEVMVEGGGAEGREEGDGDKCGGYGGGGRDGLGGYGGGV